MRSASSTRQPRRGKVVVLTAILLVPLIGLLAFTIDLGYLTLVRGELHNAADAASLAGASQLLDRDELAGRPDQGAELTAARAEAIRFARLNEAGQVKLAVDANKDNLPDGELVAGYLANPRDRSSGMSRNSGSPPRPLGPPMLWIPQVTHPPIPFVTPPQVATTYNTYNSVQVRTRRHAERNGSLSLFFARVFGRSGIDMENAATATYEDNICGFQIFRNGPPTSPLLPFAMDVNAFGNMAAGMSVIDFFKYDHTIPPDKSKDPHSYHARVRLADLHAGAILNNPSEPLHRLLDPRDSLFNPYATELIANLLPGDGIKEALLVPVAVAVEPRFPSWAPNVKVGTFVTLRLGLKGGDMSGFRRQVKHGPNEHDFKEMGGSLQLGPDGTRTVKGDYVVDAVLRETLESIKGQPRVMPLFRSINSPIPLPHGADAEFTIVGFGGLTILEVLEIPRRAAVPEVRDPLTGAVLVPGVPEGPKSLKLLVQPEFVIDATAIGGGSTLANNGAKTSRFVYRPLAITR